MKDNTGQDLKYMKDNKPKKVYNRFKQKNRIIKYTEIIIIIIVIAIVAAGLYGLLS